MILGEPRNEQHGAVDPMTTLDVLFRRAAKLDPDATALADPPNRESFTSGAPRRLTFAEADRAISAIAAQFAHMGLPADSVIGVQMPNTVEHALTILAILRAGMIAAPLPLLWRRAELTAILPRLGARALITASRVNGTDHGALAAGVAVQMFQIRHVCGFGDDLPDGVIGLDELLSEDLGDPAPLGRERPAEHVAVITTEMTPEGPILIAREHKELIAGGLVTLLEGGLKPQTRLLSCCAIGSFAGLSLTLVPWLLSGGMLSLHHGFDPAIAVQQCCDDNCDAAVLPAPLLPLVGDIGLLQDTPLRNLLAIWRAPERFAASAAWDVANVTLTDMLAFGEFGLLGSRRGPVGAPEPLPAGVITMPRGAAGGILLAETARTETGSLVLRGPMVPRHAFPPGSERGTGPRLNASADGYVDTRYPCRLVPADGTLVVTGAPPGLVAVGGYRFARIGLESEVHQADPEALITALPDALVGHRLAGVRGSADTRTRLSEMGANPLVAEAFRLASG